jgi:class 3 adenylate cyclase
LTGRLPNSTFAETLSRLPDLTDADLEKLGVVMGHRKRLLKAIADLSSSDRDCASSDQRAVKIEPEPRDTPERRQLTVMCCDLVGSTAMSARLDPEDMCLGLPREGLVPRVARHSELGR